MMFTAMFGVFAFFPVLMFWMGLGNHYDTKTHKWIEQDHAPNWPFVTAGLILLALSALFAYIGWRGRSPLTYQEREFIGLSLRRHIENLDYLDEMYLKGLESSRALGTVRADVITDMQDELDRNAEARVLAQSTLAKVDKLL